MLRISEVLPETYLTVDRMSIMSQPYQLVPGPATQGSVYSVYLIQPREVHKELPKKR